MSVTRHYVLAAGGTGGHMIPAFALASELLARGHKVALVTDQRGEAIPGVPEGLAVHVLPAGRMEGGIVARLKGLVAIWRGRALALGLLRGFQPSAVVGFGGYPALPTLLAARAARVPAVIHEQNAVLGRVNRFLAKRAAAIVTAYNTVQKMPEGCGDKVHMLGNPVRAQVLALRDRPYPSFRGEGLLRVLVTGGSQGASILSQVVPAGLALLPENLRHRLQVTQQCRPADIEAVRAAYQQHQIPAELGTYFIDMAERLADAHLFIGRAGASTIAELTAVGRPAILVPLPSAMDDHQSANAYDMAQAGGARAIRQDRFTPEELARQIEAMAADPETLGNAAHMAWNCGMPNAATDLADLVESFGAAPIQDVIRVGASDASPELSGQVAGAGA